MKDCRGMEMKPDSHSISEELMDLYGVCVMILPLCVMEVGSLIA